MNPKMPTVTEEPTAAAATPAAAPTSPPQTTVLSTMECTLLLRKAFQPSAERALGEVEDTLNTWLDRPTNNVPEERRFIRVSCTIGASLDDMHTHVEPLIPIARHTVRRSTIDAGLSESIAMYFMPPSFQKPVDEFAKVKKGGAGAAAAVIFLLILL